MFCRSELARLAKLNPKLDELGGQIVVVTMGKPEETEAFCEERAPGITCYSDPSVESYKNFGLTKGSPTQLFGPAVWLRGAQVTSEGTFEGLPLGMPVGDPFQMPGMFVVDVDGRVRFVYYSRHAGDYPDDDVLLRQMTEK